jgi:hypothetical protein
MFAVLHCGYVDCSSSFPWEVHTPLPDYTCPNTVEHYIRVCFQTVILCRVSELIKLFLHITYLFLWITWNTHNSLCNTNQ